MNGKIDFAVNIDVPDGNNREAYGADAGPAQTAEATYHVEFNPPPKQADTCDVCGSKSLFCAMMISLKQ